MEIKPQDEFYLDYNLEPNPFDDCAFCMFGTFGRELDYVLEVAKKTPHKVWTIMEHDDGEGDSIVNGYHLVNRMGYYITKEDGNEDVDYSFRYEEELC